MKTCQMEHGQKKFTALRIRTTELLFWALQNGPCHKCRESKQALSRMYILHIQCLSSSMCASRTFPLLLIVPKRHVQAFAKIPPLIPNNVRFSFPGLDVCFFHDPVAAASLILGVRVFLHVYNSFSLGFSIHDI